MKKLSIAILTLLMASTAFANNSIYGNVTFDKSGKKFIRVDMIDYKQNDGTTTPYIKVHSCNRLSETKYNCKEINPLHLSGGYELSKVLQDNFLGTPQPQYIDYNTLKYTTRYTLEGAALGSLGIIGGYLVIITVPATTALGGAIGGIRDICAYYSRDSLIKDLSAGTHKIVHFDGLEQEIANSLSNAN